MLYLETATQPLQVFSVLELDPATIPGGYSYDRFRDEFSARVRAIPAFREKLSDRFLNLDHPVWVEDSDFDIDRHVHRIGLPAPGGRAELSEISGHLAGLPLDRRRPLWEMWVIEGFGGSLNGGRLAVLLKVHHAAADGVTYANLLSQLCSTEPDPPPPDPIETTAAPTPLRMAIGGLARFASRPLQLAINVLPATIRAVVDTIRRAARGRAMAAPFTAPRTRLNARLTAHRNVAFARLELDDVKKVKNHFGVRVNDVAMALVSGVVRQFLLDRGELPGSLPGRVGSGVGARTLGGPWTKPGVGHVRSTADPDRGPCGTAEGPRRGDHQCQGTRFGDRCDAAARLQPDRRPGSPRCREAGLRASDPVSPDVQPRGVQRAGSTDALLPGCRGLGDLPVRASPPRFRLNITMWSVNGKLTSA
jgi:hypothetical protein